MHCLQEHRCSANKLFFFFSIGAKACNIGPMLSSSHMGPGSLIKLSRMIQHLFVNNTAFRISLAADQSYRPLRLSPGTHCNAFLLRCVRLLFKSGGHVFSFHGNTRGTGQDEAIGKCSFAPPHTGYHLHCIVVINSSLPVACAQLPI